MTGGDKGLQGVTKDYRNFFLSRTLSDSFSWSILHKNQSRKNLQKNLFLINTKDEKTSTFRPKSWTIPFVKMPILPSFKIHVYIV